MSVIPARDAEGKSNKAGNAPHFAMMPRMNSWNVSVANRAVNTVNCRRGRINTA
jgi:hypothetical protein